MESAINDIENSFDKMGLFNLYKLGEYVHELRIWLSGAITFEESCLDEFENITNSEAEEKMKKILRASTEITSNGLAICSGRRKLLATTPTTIEADAVVAKDGSGQFKTNH
ncbi:hypothetical protein JRO89_XSUnG0005400 [Xanthoceras sorbifolium]|uniref:Pectinesterase inhibitor domain-containing protein n=1 Tax=Xanthoceras sorbifolium TaxID=99658 RepID=A0ABQ8H0G0_9ROSI|nr:hypothetical protein JRO89_XSUnG0005400 [Xanthoceras sorbifolium]